MTGGKTTDSMIKDRLGVCPTTTATTSTTTTYTTKVGDTTSTKTTQLTQDPCNANVCSFFCTGSCGWSRAQDKCISGLSTDIEMIKARLGDCSDLVTATPKPDDGDASASTDGTGGDADASTAAQTKKLAIIIGAAVGAVIIIALIGLVLVSRAKGNSSGAGNGVQAFSNPMYAANEGNEPHYADASPAGAEMSASSGYMDVNAGGSAGYMDVGGSGYNMDMSDA